MTIRKVGSKFVVFSKEGKRLSKPLSKRAAAKRLKLPDEKVFTNIAEYGNTSAASVPIAFDECIRSGKIGHGDIVIFVAFGAGLTWGANVIKF